MARKKQRTEEEEREKWERAKTVALIVEAAARMLDFFFRR